MVRSEPALVGAAIAPLGALGLFGRAAGRVVGRPWELGVIARSIEAARSRMVCLVIEGEPGIGKTRLLLAADEQAREAGFSTIAVTADEEIRGPFLLARSLFGSAGAREAAARAGAEQLLSRALDALSNRDEAGLESVPAELRLLRIFDLTAHTLRALTSERPLALLIDDIQWADEDSLRVLRYLARTDAQSSILLVMTTRPEEAALLSEAVTLLADLDRLGMLQRLRLGRFTQLESTEFLQQVLGARVNPSTAAVMHAQAEGVPFILEEQAEAYRESGLIQQIDGVWTLARNAQRLLPSAVRTLIQRRASRVPEDTMAVLADAAVLGRRFSLRDLTDVRRILGGTPQDPDGLAALLEPAVEIGLLTKHPQGSAADYSFVHGHIRDYAADTLSGSRRRAVHSAIVDMLTVGGEDEPACLVLLAQHALAAGMPDLGAQASVRAARAALDSNAPEEALRLVELAQPGASSPADRIALLSLRDDALGMLRQSARRLEGLTELAALASALSDNRLELEVLLRRTAALRLSEDYDVAADLAGRVIAQARERGEAAIELAASLELGQSLMRTELGEAWTVADPEVDLEAADRTFERATDLARELGDERSEAAAQRELGVIATSRVRFWFVDRVATPDHVAMLVELASGVTIQEYTSRQAIFPEIVKATGHFQRALELYERLGDRRGSMATIIAMATLAWAPDIHFTGSVSYIDEIRRLTSRMKSLTQESDRALAEVQMLFGTQVYARSRGIADVAITKGEEAYALARSRGEQGIEFASAGWVALQLADLGDVVEADRWLERAAAVAAVAPNHLRARQIELWRGHVQWAAGDAVGMRAHFDRAALLASELGQVAARCEAKCWLAMAAAWLGSERGDDELLALAEQAALDTQDIAASLPGHPPWGAAADAVLARIALTQGRPEAAAWFARAYFTSLEEAVREDVDLNAKLLAAGALIEGGSNEEREMARATLRLDLALTARRITDERVRARWFRSRIGRELTRLAGTLDAPPADQDAAARSVEESERELLRLVVQGQTNREIATALGLSETEVASRLAQLFAKIGAASRADATMAVFLEKLV